MFYQKKKSAPIFSPIEYRQFQSRTVSKTLRQHYINTLFKLHSGSD